MRNFFKDFLLIKNISPENIEDLNKNNLGLCYVSDIDLIDDYFIYSIGMNPKKKEKLYIISITTKSDNIDYYKTLSSKIKFEDENEFSIKDDKKIFIKNIDKY